MTEETTQGVDPESVAAQVVRLANELPGTPQRMKVEAAGTAVEVDWDTTADPAGEPAAATPSPDDQPGGPRITAPLVGTFYRAPGPGEAPFVEVGDVVAEGQQVGIVEAMKLMNPVEATQSGTVAELLAGDGEMVEYGQPLILLSRDGS
ncbi:acetyl-CoA carboxylase biotin carboxyl carrier protein [Lentzea kentuckyensis]|uniref:acetyl-CoA carboxylase biotin carboxyl carrier protein n=1 Tax=Lentzea kentuckyensis TaxID=360086 RepID=UPI000A39821A|nr:acetyl-CoA carboxylase biotin carboxyl carrier protein [Lentzea kentuckyensis]